MCQAWRQVFTSRSSLWTDLSCTDRDKTRVYLERSNPSPINLSLRREGNLTSPDPFLQITPQAIARLKSLSVKGTPWDLQNILPHLSYPAPLLEDLSIISSREHKLPVLAPAFFNGDLTLLRELRLERVCTELPWRNMVNLTSLTLYNTSPASVGRLLDFFESAPHLRDIHLSLESPIPDAQNGRLVSLACLKTMWIDGLSSVLLDHLLIPVGARLNTEIDLSTHPPRFLDNLKNLLNFTEIGLSEWGPIPRMGFSGPNGEVNMWADCSRGISSMVEVLTQLDTSKTKLLAAMCTDDLSSASIYQALLPMKDLRAIVISQCSTALAFIHTLDPGMSPSGVAVCPKLEKLEFEYRKTLDIKDLRNGGGKGVNRGETQVCHDRLL